VAKRDPLPSPHQQQPVLTEITSSGRTTVKAIGRNMAMTCPRGQSFPITRYDAIFGMGLQDFNGDIIVYYDMEGEGSWKIMGLRLP